MILIGVTKMVADAVSDRHKCVMQHRPISNRHEALEPVMGLPPSHHQARAVSVRLQCKNGTWHT